MEKGELYYGLDSWKEYFSLFGNFFIPQAYYQ